MNDLLPTGWGLVGLIAAIIVVAWIILRKLRPRSDISSPTLGADLDWTQPDDALKKVHDFVVNNGTGAINWYQNRRQPKRLWGAVLRFGALIATAGAGFVPLSANLGIGAAAVGNAPGGIDSVWSTVLVGLAGLLVSIDVLGGYTSGWVRYMLAQQKVERCQDAFLLEWNALRVAGTPPAGMLDRAKTFLLAVGKIIDDETREWAMDFQNALKELDKARLKAEETERAGAITVSVANHQNVTGWTLEVDGAQRGATAGKNLAIADVAIGQRKLRAAGKDTNGKTLADETIVKVDGGQAVSVQMQLS
jgi:hypothetical protein